MIFGLLLFCHGMAHRSDSPSSRALPLCLEIIISFFHFFFFHVFYTSLHFTSRYVGGFRRVVVWYEA